MDTQQLQTLSDEDLKTLAQEAHNILVKREKERQRKAKEEIRKLAAQVGLEVAINDKPPTRKRRRRGKKQTSPGPETTPTGVSNPE